MNKPRMARIRDLKHLFPTIDGECPRCQAMEFSRFYFLLKLVYQCTAEATDVIRIWDPDDKQLNRLPVCQYHKDNWLKYFGSEFNDKGEIQRKLTV